MCLAVVAWNASARFPLVVAANRDEFQSRPTAAMAWWPSTGETPSILAGRDLQAGGTWLGLGSQGRFALLTNVRDPAAHDPNAASRGDLVVQWLEGLSAYGVLDAAISRGVNGFNLVAIDTATGDAFHVGNRPPAVTRVGDGIVGVSNAGLDTPWPKVTALKARAGAILASAADVATLQRQLLDALADDARAPDHLLPSTGVTLEWERQLSSIFIRSDDRRYGTRSSSIVVAERTGDGVVAHVLERSYDANGDVIGDRRFALDGWGATAARR